MTLRDPYSTTVKTVIRIHRLNIFYTPSRVGFGGFVAFFYFLYSVFFLVLGLSASFLTCKVRALAAELLSVETH